MKKYILLWLTFFLAVFFFASPEAFAVDNSKLSDFNTSEFIDTTTVWEQGIYNTFIRFARDLKNLFYIIATIFFLIITIQLILAGNTEEALGKFKKWIIWITVGIIVMQVALVFTTLLFDPRTSYEWSLSSIWMDRAYFFFENLIWPLIELLQTLASFFFIAIAMYAFYRLVTANGNEEAIWWAKKTIWFALVWFLIIYLARAIVEAFYGRINCNPHTIGPIIISGECRNIQDISSWVQIIINLINWLNAFVAIVVVLMILWAGTQILLSAWDEEKLKKSKNSLIFIAIGIFILISNYLILTFFLRPESII